MRRFPLLPLKALAALAFVSVACEDTEPPGAPVPLIDIGDGSKVKAHRVLQAVESLAISHDVTVYFQQAGQDRRSIFALNREEADRLPGDYMIVRVSAEQFSVNEELVTLQDFRSRIQRYADTAKMVKATAVLLVTAEEAASGQRLVAVFHELSEAGLTTIIAIP